MHFCAHDALYAGGDSLENRIEFIDELLDTRDDLYDLIVWQMDEQGFCDLLTIQRARLYEVLAREAVESLHTDLLDGWLNANPHTTQDEARGIRFVLARY